MLGPHVGPSVAAKLNARFPASTGGAVRWEGGPRGGVLLLGTHFLGLSESDAVEAIRALPPVTTAEAARRVGVTPSYLRRLIREGRIGADPVPGGYRVRLDWLDAFVAQRRGRGRPRNPT